MIHKKGSFKLLFLCVVHTKDYSYQPNFTFCKEKTSFM